MSKLKIVYITSLLLFLINISFQAQNLSPKPVRMAVAGIVHGHAVFVLGRKGPGDIELVGVCDKNTELAQSYAKKYGFSTSIIFNDLPKMLDAVKPDVVVAFGSILDHMEVVEACAPRRINVMVEKPLATTVDQAERMVALAKKYKIYILTDYETSWYPTTAKSYQLVNDSNFIGNIKKVVIHDGHQGPVEIGCNKEFLNWLTDPVQNGGGALFDFGCYGANLMTYLMNGQMPESVTAVVQHFKPKIYPKVEDEATVIVTYPTAQCIIQASWNWPFGRKDMEIYGESGYVISENNNTLRLRNSKMTLEKIANVSDKDIPVYTDPFSYFIDVIHGKIKMKPYGLYSLENNLIVVKILEAAKISAKKGKTVKL